MAHRSGDVATLLDCWECIKQKGHLSRQQLDVLTARVENEVSGNDICAVKLSAITQLFKSATRVDGLGMRSSCCYLLVNTPLVECLLGCISSNSKLIAFLACKAFVAVVTSNVMEDSARCQWGDSLCQKIIESPALLQRSPSYDCKTMVFGLESLRLLVKHWRVAMTDRKETSEPMQGSFIAGCIQSRFLPLIDVAFEVHLQLSSIRSIPQCVYLAVCDDVGSFLAFHRETLLFTAPVCLNNATTFPSGSHTDVSALAHLRETSMALIPRWVSLLDNASYPSRVKRQILELVSCSLPTELLCSSIPISSSLADVVRYCLQSDSYSEFCSLVLQGVQLLVSRESSDISSFVVNAMRSEDESLCVQAFMLVSLKLAVGFLKAIETDLIADDLWQCLNDCILKPIDDLLIDVLWLHMEGCNQLKKLSRVPEELQQILTNHIPRSHHMFSRLVKFLRFDHSVLLDFLISSETRFLDYFTHYLKMLIQNWNAFRSPHRKLEILSQSREVEADAGVSDVDSEATTSDCVDSVMTVLIRLRLAMERLQCQGLFPYNAAPLLALLERVEECYENDTDTTEL
ncbi:protein Lines homolog 1-like isoform X2 [Corticium candelabrum]|uniref:protein Lines homolog 1-like isoform X2 n=1 Tax=Corticium candelabrum TaxID=121492 RepID=UPI002E254F5C|nr:protein Lines homolog 1-like isoform X2 [Corticium candelabrum]